MIAVYIANTRILITTDYYKNVVPTTNTKSKNRPINVILT